MLRNTDMPFHDSEYLQTNGSLVGGGFFGMTTNQ